MPIEFHCPGCQRILRVPDETAGKQAKCPQCGTVSVIPAGATSAGGAVPDVPPPISQVPSISSGAGTGNPFGVGPRPEVEVNPYHAPAMAGTRDWVTFRQGPFRPTVMSVGDVFNHAWDIYRREFGMCFLGVFVFAVIVISFGIASAGLDIVRDNTMDRDVKLTLSLVSVGVQLVGQIVQMWLSAGLIIYFLGIVRGNQPDLGNLFRGGKYLLRIIGGSLLLGFGIVAVCIVIFIPTAIVGPMWLVVAMPVVILLVLWTSLAFSQFIYLIVDRDAGAIDSLSLSMQVTKGNKLRLILLGLLATLLMLLGLLACGIGALFAMPLTYILAVVAYLHMSGQQVPQ